MLNDEHTSILGLHWSPVPDVYTFRVNIVWPSTKAVTKRSVLSAASEIYDPLGFTAPVTMISKIFLQEIHQMKVGWDVEMNSDFTNRWIDHVNTLRQLNDITIPRWMHTKRGIDTEVHGFSDASEQGYGAAIYMVVRDNGRTMSSIITSKTHVAPISKQTIPRLELCGAELLTRLMNEVRAACHIEHAKYYLYSDSMVVLNWIKKSPLDLKKFVANRVEKIQKQCDISVWQYIPTKQNPADLCSRGMNPSELVKCELWWKGPNVILHKKDPKEAPQRLTAEITEQIRNEFKPSFVGKVTVKNTYWLQHKGQTLIERTNSLKKLITSTLYVRLFIERFVLKLGKDFNVIGSADKLSIKWALNYWIKYTQMKYFNDDLRYLERYNDVHKSSKLTSLCPFIDEEGIMRVRGRIQNAEVSYDEKHPIIIPAHSEMSKLLLLEAHEATLHGNKQLMLHYVRTKYWIIGARKSAGSIIKACVTCTRYAANEQEQIMADLPKERVANVRPFYYCGVDYFGPIKVKRAEGRCKVLENGYGAVFVCMTTKMVHIECVSDLSTTKFIWALERLSSVYQTPVKLFSDNGRNFVGAANELSKVLESWQSAEVDHFLTQRGILWKFITPRAPFQGGLWEAAVKSAKYHLKRVLNGRIFTVEQYNTLFAKISAVLNSRPLVRLNDDPLELNYLTPSHAVIGERLVQPLSTNLNEIPLGRVHQHYELDKIHQDFWKVWRKEYLGTQQNRYKWNQKSGNLQIDDFVLLKDDNVPPSVWPIARVIEVFPGADGMVRNVKIRTPKTDLLRPVQKLVKLSLEEPEQIQNVDQIETLEQVNEHEATVQGTESEQNEQHHQNDEQEQK